MRTFKKIESVFYILFLIIAFTACTQRQIQGEIFLDENGNNIKDLGEPVLEAVPFSVTLDESSFKYGTTDQRGQFSIFMDNGHSEGTYCVKVNPSNLVLLQPTSTSSTSKNLIPNNNDTNTDDGTGTDTDSDEFDSSACSTNSAGIPDCNDQDCCSRTQCSSSALCQEEEDTSNDSCPLQENGEPDCNDSRCANRSACQTDNVTTQSMESCGTPSSSTMVLNLDVPVTVDYATRVEKITQNYPKTTSIGDTIDINITYPSSCTFELYTLPASLIPVGLESSFNEMTHELSLESAILENSEKVTRDDMPPFGHDRLNSFALTLKVVEGEGLAETSHVIQPSLICPNDNRVKASATTVNIKTEGAISLQSQITPSCPALGESASISADIANHLSIDYSNAHYTVSIAGGSGHVSIANLPENCLNKGSSIECDLASFDAGSSKNITFGYEMAASTPSSTTVSFTPRLEVDGTVYTDSVINCTY